jgi:hypothetical protein
VQSCRQSADFTVTLHLYQEQTGGTGETGAKTILSFLQFLLFCVNHDRSVTVEAAD